MPPKMMTRSAGRSTAEPQGGRTGGRTGKGSGRTRGRTSDHGSAGIDEQGGQVGNHGNNQGNNRNQNGNAINGNIHGDVRNVIVNNGRRIESVQDMSGRGDNQKVKYTAGLFDGKALTLVPHLVTLENKRIEMYIYGLDLQIREMVAATEPTTIQKLVQKASTVTDEVIRNGSLKKNSKKRGNGGEPRDRNVKDDNKMTRTTNAFAITANLVRREYTVAAPKCANYNLHHSPESPCGACFNCNRLGHLAKDCRVVPRMVNPVNARNLTATHGEQRQPGTWKGIYVGSKGGSPGPKHRDA
uniref:CCHC-type domain-containing protein n=1 Tax=Tanacetum cinerariifolium TaxID=118510 RepID=A0A6L2J8S1_TANCI|nr:hypothetical protein [Tanacetum cinerariifolium]